MGMKSERLCFSSAWNRRQRGPLRTRPTPRAAGTAARQEVREPSATGSKGGWGGEGAKCASNFLSSNCIASRPLHLLLIWRVWLLKAEEWLQCGGIRKHHGTSPEESQHKTPQDGKNNSSQNRGAYCLVCLWME